METLIQHNRITQYDLAELFNKAYIRTATLEKGVSGFQAAGIFPLNPGKFSAYDFEVSDSHQSITVQVSGDEEDNDQGNEIVGHGNAVELSDDLGSVGLSQIEKPNSPKHKTADSSGELEPVAGISGSVKSCRYFPFTEKNSRCIPRK